MSLRGEVLGSYRLLLRACKNLCQDDIPAFNRAKTKIKEEFYKYADVQNQQEIIKLIGSAVEAERFLRQNVVQVAPVKDDLYRLRITKDTVLSDNPIPPPNPPS